MMVALRRLLVTSSDQDGCEKITLLVDPFENLVRGEREDARILDLLPGERSRDRRLWARPQRVRCDGRLGSGILAPVDEHLARPELPLHPADDQAAVLGLQPL